MLTKLRAQLQSHHRRYSLRWHLGGVLLIKAMVLYIIWLAWFNHPISLKPQQIADVLLTSTPVSSCSRKDHCDATQP